MISGVGEAPGNEIVRKPGCIAGQILVALDCQSAAQPGRRAGAPPAAVGQPFRLRQGFHLRRGGCDGQDGGQDGGRAEWAVRWGRPKEPKLKAGIRPAKM
jgi:hypothetical protein